MITETEITYINRYMKILYDLPIALEFRSLTNMDEACLASYKEIVSVPIDLSVIKRKAECKMYHKSSEWKDDIEMLYKNTALFHGQDHILTLCARELADYVKLKCEYIPKSAWEDWTIAVKKTQRAFQMIMSARPVLATISPRSSKPSGEKIDGVGSSS